MNPFKSLSIFLLTLIVLTACENEIPTADPKFPGDVYPVKIITGKISYDQNESIVVEVINTSDSAAMYYKCSSYEGIPPHVNKLANDEWSTYWAAICNGYNSYCCEKLEAGESYKDTLDMEFATGTNRLEYLFIVGPGNEYQSYFSNSFEVKAKK